MTVAFDAYSNPGAFTTGNASWTHTPVGTPKGVLVLVSISGSSTDVTAVSYGGVGLSRVSGAPNTLSGENSETDCWFLGAGIPTGAQTVSVTVIGANNMQVHCITLTAAADTEIVDSDGTINSTASANPSVTLSLGGRSSFCAIVLGSGQNAVTGITPLSSWTSRNEEDFGSQTGACYSYDTIGTADVTAGWTQTSDDACAVAVAVSEVQPPTITPGWFCSRGGWF